MPKEVYAATRRTRLLKAECRQHGQIVYGSRKVFEAAMPICGLCREPMISDAWLDELDEQSALRTGGDGPTAFDRHQVLCTRQPSSCDACGGEIPAGESCWDSTISDGGLTRYRQCESCAPGAGAAVSTMPGTQGDRRQEW
jgi:hypothetical protein